MARWEKISVTALLLCLFSALVGQAWWLTLTVDEPAHLLSAHLYWKGRDRLYPRDVPPLIKIVGGWPSLFFDMPVPPDLGQAGDPRQEWTESAEMVGRMALNGSRLQSYLFCSRLALTSLSVLAVVVLWLWARRLFDPLTGVIVASLWAMTPLALGHGALFKNDVAATTTYLLFWYVAWRYWSSPELKEAVLLGTVVALVTLSKNSMLFLLPVAPAVAALRCGLSRRTVAHMLLIVLACLGVLVGAWPSDWHWISQTEVASVAAEQNAPPPWFLTVVGKLTWVPVPEALWIGTVSLFRANASFLPVYMLGQIYPAGHRGYFL
ncbi:MAG TPA: glycosyltransferase family 39 protein, partial [Bryobacteraceae bacterium]|nr:glycosyltransferase family 39 protein [Bryobacteraceae bacterium]